MSNVAVRSALEAALVAMTPALATAWENMPYKNADGTDGTPTPGVPYQQVHLLAARPARLEMSGKWSREQGFMQIDLKYPLNAGSGAAAARAKLIRDTFYDGRSLSASGVTTLIEGEAEISPGRTEPDRYVVPVKVRFYANILRS